MTESQEQAAPQSAIEQAAYEAIDNGLSVFPLSPVDKRPLVRWREFQSRRPTYEEIEGWFRKWPDANLALVTGAISGVVVVDADNPEAVAYAKANGLSSPISVTTRRGRHFYFKHPGGSARYPNRAGGNPGRHGDWPYLPGLDFRGDGGYVVMPPSVSRKEGHPDHVYAMEMAVDWDDMPVWTGTKPSLIDVADLDSVPPEETLAALDFSRIAAKRPEDYLPTWERIERRVLELGRGLKDGEGRNDALMRYASEMVMEGLAGDELRQACRAFCERFFEDPLPPEEFEATVRSMEESERINHPERFDPNTGEHLGRKAKTKAGGSFRPIYADDADSILASMAKERFLVDPFMRPASIVQIYGYSGHGKSTIAQMLLWHLAMGKSFGPYDIARPARILYFDWENGAATIADRLRTLRQSFGPVGRNLAVWSPALIAPEHGGDINLMTEEGVAVFRRWIEEVDPEVVVIDTIRSAWPGMQENSAEEWSRVNKLALAMRNAGKSIILLHHSNKPGDAGLGREAGSSNQLTVIETQIRVTQLFEDAHIAQVKGGKVLPEDIAVVLRDRRRDPNDRILMWFELSYGKVREYTDNHMPSCVVGVVEADSGARYLVWQRSPKQMARDLAAKGYPVNEIAAHLQLPTAVVRKWLGMEP